MGVAEKLKNYILMNIFSLSPEEADQGEGNEQVKQSEEKERAGSFASGIAHEFPRFIAHINARNDECYRPKEVHFFCDGRPESDDSETKGEKSGDARTAFAAKVTIRPHLVARAFVFVPAQPIDGYKMRELPKNH